MDRPRHYDQLGVNKIGKNIRKSPLHQPKVLNGIVPSRPQQVYSISKNDFTSIVHSPSRESLPQTPPLPQIPLKPESTLLQKIRPAAITQINRPHVSSPVLAQPTHDLAARPLTQLLPHGSQPMMGHGDGDQFWSDTAELPVSVCMRYLQSSLGDSRPNGNQIQPSHEYELEPKVVGNAQPHPPAQSHNHPSPRFNGSASSMPILPSPRFSFPTQQMYNRSLPSPRFNGRGILPSPTSQYLLQSPTAYRKSFSPRSPYPLPSPGVQYPPPLKPRSFTLSSMEPGILGPGTIPQPPASPGLVFPSPPFGI